MSTALRVSSMGVSGSQACNCHRSMWSTPSRRKDPLRLLSRWLREASNLRSLLGRETALSR